MIKIKQNPEYNKIITEFKTFATKLDKLIEKYELYDPEGIDYTIEFHVNKNSKTLHINPFWAAFNTDYPASIEDDKIIDYLNEITPMNATFSVYSEDEEYEEELIFEHKVVSNNKDKLCDFFEENNIKDNFTLIYMPCVNEVFLQRGAIRYDTSEYYSIKKILAHFNKLLA